MKTSSFRQPHARVGDEGDKPSCLIVLHSTVSLYAFDVLKRYGLASLVVLKVRQIDTREGVLAVETMLLDVKVDDGTDGREVALHRVRRQTLTQKVITKGCSVRERVGIDRSIAQDVDDGLDVPFSSSTEHLTFTNAFQSQV